MIILQSLRCSGPVLALALGCGSCVFGSDGLGPVLPAEAPPGETPPVVLAAPLDSFDDSAALPCPPPRGRFSWLHRRSPMQSRLDYAAVGEATNAQLDPPFGTAFQAIMRAQIAKGEAALMVLHQYDFVPGTATLNYSGRLRLQKIVSLAPQNSFPIIIETARYDPALDAARHASVVSELDSMPFVVPAERVIIGRSPQRGMDGLDAERVHRNLLNLTIMGDAGGSSAAPAGGAATGVPLQ